VKVKKLAHLIALIGVMGPAMAQEIQPQGPMQRVEVTGSSIKRIAKEGALPVQVITFDQLQKQGINNAEELMRVLASNGTGANNTTSSNNVFGADADRLAGGAAFASLRGLGPNSTLVLLNGRRVATYGKSGNAVDLNSIPMAAIARIEILKDGASAIYGTDAVGGVMNFILKTDYHGLEASATTTGTQAGGGATHRVSLLGGKGDLDSDGFNLMGTVSYTKNEELDSHQRSFANGFQPARGLSPDTTGTPFANQLTGTGSALGTSFQMPGDSNKYLQAGLLSLQGKCDTVPGMSQYQTDLWPNVTSPLRTKYSCAYDYGADYVMQSPAEQTNVLGRASYKLAPDHKVFVEAMGSRSEVISILTPAQIATSIANGNAYPVGGPYYQDLSSYIPTFDKTKPILYKWRANPVGNRTQGNTTESARVLLGFEGTVHNWDYKLGLSQAQSTTKTTLLDGYAFTSQLYKVLGSGIVNPWSTQGQTKEAMDAINATKYTGAFQHGKTTLTQLDGNLSGEIYQLPAGALSAAVGFDLRRESYTFGQDVDATQILLSPGNAGLPKATRDIKAFYTELIAPVTKDLELQLALRRDDYSVVGATTNPKIAFRYQPTSWLLFRGSANKGFLAPSFAQLYTGSLDQQLASGVVDTVGCQLHPNDPAFCAPERINYKSGGNQNLRPETSKQGTLGVVFEPLKGFSASLDYWAINMKDRILNRSALIVLANPVALSGNIIRDPQTGLIDYVQAGWINAAGARARGADLGLRGNGSFAGAYKWNAALDGTWTQSYKFAEIDGQPYKEYVGQFFTRDLYLRWKHNATFSVARGDWSVLLSNTFASGYKDELPNGGKGTPPPGFNPDVSSYSIFGLSSTYSGIKNTTVTVGISNLFDRDPPFTAHNVDEVVGAGWDPRVADPRGRTFSFNVKYKFF
jgi:iron complex outermembrane recepter protein